MAKKQRSKPKSKKAKPISAHKKIYGKEYHEVKYHAVRCPICNSRIDEYGFCACGAGGS
jgi:hypothetical protein